jgi:hypothetical protein
MTNRANFDAGDPHAPEGFKTWGEAISDEVDSGTTVPEPDSPTEDDLFILRATGSGFEWVEITEDET